MNMKFLDSNTLRLAVITGAQNIISNKDSLNRINVFPMADYDTGTNMASTAEYIIFNLSSIIETDNLKILMRELSESSLIGAKGNSGIILAQFFNGLTRSITAEKKLSIDEFSRAVQIAVKAAYQAVADPKEGTMLTVIHDWGQSILDHSSVSDDFKRVFELSLQAASEALAKTTNTLDALKKAGVVDAGAKGFFHLIEGFTHFIIHGRSAVHVNETATSLQIEDIAAFEMESIPYRYCTEIVLEVNPASRMIEKEELSRYGDSAVVISTERYTKLHIHTNNPETIAEVVEKRGRIMHSKVDDMVRQYNAVNRKRYKIALVTDTSCDLPISILDAYDIHLLIAKISIDEQLYSAKHTIGAQKIYDTLRNRPDVVLKTSQPSLAEFQRLFEFLAGHYEAVLYIGTGSSMNGFVSTATAVAKQINTKTRVIVVDSKSISTVLGLIVIEIAREIEKGTPIEKILPLLDSLISRARLYVLVPSVDRLIRSGRISRSKGMIAQMLGMKPILSCSHGRLTKASSVFSKKSGFNFFIKQIGKDIPPGTKANFIIGHADAFEEAQWLSGELRMRYDVVHDVPIVDADPGITVHTGLGAIGVGYILPEINSFKQ